MESSQEHKHPIRDEPSVRTADTTAANTTMDENTNKSKQDKRTAMAKRGIKSLAVMVAVPTLLTLGSICLSGSKHGGGSHGKFAKPPSWLLPPPWALHLASLVVSFLMGFSAWLVWADGGFHRKPRAFQIYLAWLVLNVAWNPTVIGCGATRVGLAVSLAMVGALFGCFRLFKEVSPISGNLVMPCLALSGLMALVNLKLVFT